MLRKFIFVSALLITGSSQAQRTVDVNKDNVNGAALVFGVFGEPIQLYKYVKVVEGTPYFNEEWMRGSVITQDSNEYTNLRLRLDLVTNALEFLDKNGQPMVATGVIRGIRLVDSITGKSNEFVHSFAFNNQEVPTGWYQQLSSGKATIYKRTVKQIQESKPYSSAITEQRITSSTQYFLLKGNSFVRIKKFKDLPDLLSDKKALIAKTSSDNKLTGKSDQDYIDILLVYNKE